jgi:hypothetical protein
MFKKVLTLFFLIKKHEVGEGWFNHRESYTCIHAHSSDIEDVVRGEKTSIGTCIRPYMWSFRRVPR